MERITLEIQLSLSDFTSFDIESTGHNSILYRTLEKDFQFLVNMVVCNGLVYKVF